MADELKQSQLARIVVPAITDAEYSKNLADAFEKINDNFKKIASLPFLQGVQGDSYQLEEYPIWKKDTTENWILTEDGKILLDSIFGMDTTEYGNSFNDIRTCIGQTMPEENGVSPIDFFKNGNDIVNNSLYFYVIKDDTGNIIEKQLGQYYYFVDGRLKEIGNIYNSENSGSALSVFNDYTGFYQYKYDTKNSNGEYIKVEILPTIYYDRNKNDICWKFNGNETGISAIGVKGADGKDADLSIVKVDLNNENSVYSNNSTSGKVIGILDTSANNGEAAQWITDTKYFKTGKALIYMSGKIPVENTENSNTNPLSGETETNDMPINDFAYGEIVKQSDEYIAYWEPNCVFSKVITNSAFTQYFYNMGSVSYTNNAPYFLAIPSIQNRDSSTDEAKQHAHIIKGYDGSKDSNIESINIFHSDNAFDKGGNQYINATESSNTKTLNIKNYNTQINKKLTVSGSAEVSGGLTVNNGGLSVKSGNLSVTNNATISKKLTVSGSAEVSGGLTVNNGGAVISSGGIQVTTEKPEALPGTNENADVKSNVLIGHNNPGGGKYNYFTEDITNCGYPLVTMSYGFDEDTSELKESKDCIVFGNADICALTWNNNKYEPGTLYLQDIFKYKGKTKVGGALEVDGAATFDGKTEIKYILDSKDKESGALVVKGGVGIGKKLNVGSANTAVSTETGYSGALVVTGGVGIGKNLIVGGTSQFNGLASMQSNLQVLGGLSVSGVSNFYNPVKIYEDDDSNSTTTGALVVTGGVGIGKNLNVGGSASFYDDLFVGGTLGVSGTTSFYDDLFVGGSLGVSGGADFDSYLSVGGDLGVSGGASFYDDLYILSTASSSNASSGALVVAGGVGIGENLNVKGTLGVTGAVTFDADLTVDSEIFAETLTVSDSINAGSIDSTNLSSTYLSVGDEIFTETLTVSDSITTGTIDSTQLNSASAYLENLEVSNEVFKNTIISDDELIYINNKSHQSIQEIVNAYWDATIKDNNTSGKANFSNTGYSGLNKPITSSWYARSNKATITCPVIYYSPKLTVKNNNATGVNKVEGCDIWCSFKIYLHDNTNNTDINLYNQTNIKRESNDDTPPKGTTTYEWTPISSTAINQEVEVTTGHSYTLKISCSVDNYSTNGAYTNNVIVSANSYSVYSANDASCTISQKYQLSTAVRKIIIFNNGVVAGANKGNCGGLFVNPGNIVTLFGTKLDGSNVKIKSVPINRILDLPEFNDINWS